jgi:perosamine synthetase
MPDDLFGDHIPLLRPWVGEEEVRAVSQVILSGWITQGSRVIDFENAVAEYVRARYAVATNSCTSALHLSLHLSGIGPGDEVICPSFTCMATANAIHHTGAVPVFAEIDPRTYNLDPDAAANAISPRTRAILPVHQIGLPVDRDAFASLAKKRNLILVEDAATALSATYKGRRVGGLGSPTCFSFHPRKMITTGEGGMITTDDGELVEKARVLRSTGASISDLERHKAKGVLVQQYVSVGYNYRMTDMQAAMGLVQMGKIHAMTEQRVQQARRYDEAFTKIEEIVPPFVPPNVTHAYTSYLIRLKPASRVRRDDLLEGMANRGISCRVGIQPLHQEPIYRSLYPDLRLPITEETAETGLFLPIYPGMTEGQQDRVITALKDILVHGR